MGNSYCLIIKGYLIMQYHPHPQKSCSSLFRCVHPFQYSGLCRLFTKYIQATYHYNLSLINVNQIYIGCALDIKSIFRIFRVQNPHQFQQHPPRE